ncbi:MAG: hypothetical protein JOY54_08845 [Acidobacteriaceae bacterium]|nr:hypothetical protein [Acidobacteriaceae bacterium]
MRCLFLVTFVAAVVVATGCSRQRPTGVYVDSSFRPFLPANAIALSEINVEALKQTPFYKRNQSTFEQYGLNAMAEQVGIDPRRDVSKLLIVWNGKEPLVIAKGAFPARTIDAKLIQLGAQRTSYQNYTLFGYLAHSANASVAFVDDKLAVAGPMAAVHTALDTDANGTGRVPEILEAEFSKLPKEAEVWEVSSGPLLANVPLRQDLESALSNIANFVSKTRAGVTVGSGVRFDAEITCISDEGAQRVKDALRGSIGLARLATNNNNLDLLSLWDSVKVAQNGQTVDVTADLSAELADKLLANAQQLKDKAREELQQR